MIAIKPFKVDVSDETIKSIRARVAAYPWHEMPDDGGWDYGTNLDYMKEFCDYWVNDYDWRAQEAEINRFPHFKASVDGIDLHFIHEKGSGTNPKPLIISHGWPGTIVEFLDFIDLLAHPEKHGGNIEDAFDVVAPSLPGFGFSGRPPRPYGLKIMRVVRSTRTRDQLWNKQHINTKN